MMKVRSTPSCALVAVACLGCFARSTTGFVVGPTTAARRVVNPCNVGASNSFSVSCASRSPSHFTGTSLNPLVVQSHVGAAHGIVAAGYGARQLSMMSTEAKKTVIITGASSGKNYLLRYPVSNPGTSFPTFRVTCHTLRGIPRDCSRFLVGLIRSGTVSLLDMTRASYLSVCSAKTRSNHVRS